MRAMPIASSMSNCLPSTIVGMTRCLPPSSTVAVITLLRVPSALSTTGCLVGNMLGALPGADFTAAPVTPSTGPPLALAFGLPSADFTAAPVTPSTGPPLALAFGLPSADSTAAPVTPSTGPPLGGAPGFPPGRTNGARIASPEFDRDPRAALSMARSTTSFADFCSLGGAAEACRRSFMIPRARPTRSSACCAAWGAPWPSDSRKEAPNPDPQNSWASRNDFSALAYSGSLLLIPADRMASSNANLGVLLVTIGRNGANSSTASDRKSSWSMSLP
uniref:Uncharacterized protein n=1 Tax=uncultured marine virus TaxID=186617 RepID=A0A0F7L2A9_9VIRU|nr:hypothetical protein [uncultured marine virus]